MAQGGDDAAPALGGAMPKTPPAPVTTSGSFRVALRSLAWPAPDETTTTTTTTPEALDASQLWWLHVALELPTPSTSLLDGVWFGPEDDNAATPSVERPPNGRSAAPLDYLQSSRPVALTPATIDRLVRARLRIGLYRGATRSRTTDELVGEGSVAFSRALWGSPAREPALPIVPSDGSNATRATVDVVLECDTAFADYTLGARVLRLSAPTLSRLPREWLPPPTAWETDEQALAFCAAPERNTATYELELLLPELSSCDDGDAGPPQTESVRFAGGKLRFEPTPPTSRHADAGETQDGTPPSTLSGAWVITFDAAPPIAKLYLRRAVARLVDFLEVERFVRGIIRRTGVEHSGRVTVALQLRLDGLLEPGSNRACVQAALRKVAPLPREALEQELAGATANDEKKRLQALLNDYEALNQAAVALGASVRGARTTLAAVAEVERAPLVQPPPPPTPSSARAIPELVPPRDLQEEHDQEREPLKDLRAELRRVVLAVLDEYDAATQALGSGSGDGDGPPPTREDKRQWIVFKLNTRGAYHELKDRLKKRIVPVIREQFADLAEAAAADAMDHDEADNVVAGPTDHDRANAPRREGASPAKARTRAYVARLHGALMDEVHAVLHETCYTAGDALAATRADLAPRDDAKITATLQEFWLRALEHEVNGDGDKAEACHLDRVAFAEARARERPALAHALEPTLGRVWFDYARFCLGQNEPDKAGGALRQSLALEPRALGPLLALGALLCERRDLGATDLEDVLRNAIDEARTRTPGSEGELAVAHGLLALVYHESGRDETGNLVLFELLRAREALNKAPRSTAAAADGDGRDSAEPSVAVGACLSSVWLAVAAQAHELRLRGLTQTALDLAERFRRPRDTLRAAERVLARTIQAELLSLRGDGDAATALLLEAVEIDPTAADAWLVLGRTYLQLRGEPSQSQRAIASLQRAAAHRRRLRPEARLALLVHLGLALVQTSQFAAARATFLEASDEFPTASTWLGVGIASIRLEDWAGAHAALAEANRRDPGNPEVWGYLGLVALSAPGTEAPTHASDGEPRAAQRYVRQALRHQLANPALLRELASGFLARDRLEDAERLLRRALVFQESSLARKTLADVLAAQHCAEDALGHYRRALDAPDAGSSERVELLGKCATLLVTLGRPDEALEYRRMAAQFLEQQQHEDAWRKADEPEEAGDEGGDDAPGRVAEDDVQLRESSAAAAAAAPVVR